MVTWITGAGGFIGRHLAANLAGKAKRVGLGFALQDEVDGLNLRIQGPLTPDLFSRAAREGGGPTTIYHLAGGNSVGASVEDPERERQRTVPGLGALITWLRAHAPKATLVFASSAAVYGADHRGAINEEASLVPFSPYGIHKRECETMVDEAGATWGQPSAIVRLFSVYGDGLRRQLLWDLCRRLDAGESPIVLGGDGEELRDFLHVRDAVAILELAARVASAAVPVLNGGTGQGRCVRTVAEDTASLWGAHPSTIAFNGRHRSGDPRSLIADVSRIAELGFVPKVTWKSGLAGYVGWYRAQTA